MAQYLDKAGLEYLWGKIEDTFIDNEEFSSGLADKLTKDDVSMSYSDGKILLTVNGELRGEIDATPFIKDGMLKDVEVITVDDSNVADVAVILPGITVGEKVIRFEWNTDGDVSVDYIKTTDIAVDPETSNTKVSEAIPVAGGPLASLAASVFPNGITTDMSLQDVLFALFCEELWPNPAATASYGSLTSTLSAPTSSFANNNKVVAIGSTQTIGTVSAKNAVANAPSLTFDNFSYGYATETGKFTATSTETNPTTVKANVTTNNVTYTLNRDYTGFDGVSDGDPLTGADATSLSFAQATLKAGLGTNKVVYTLSVSGQVHSATVAAPSVYYALSNLGNTDKMVGEVSTPQQKVDKTNTYTYTPSPATPSAKTLTYTCTGVYPVYTNANTTANLADATVEKIADVSTFEVSYGPETTAMHAFVYPSSHTLSKVEVWNPLSSSYGDYVGGSATADIKQTVNGTEYDYKKWTRSGSAYAETTKFRFTLNKKTSVA